MFVYGNKSINYGNAAIQGYFSPGHRQNRMLGMTGTIIELSHQTRLYSGYNAAVVTETTTVASSFVCLSNRAGHQLRLKPVEVANIAKRALS